MKIHEYQAKKIFQAYEIPTPQGYIAYTPEEAQKVASDLEGPIWVVKAQIHAGGRGKGGGVKLAKSLGEVKDLATQILGMNLITPQTGPQGQKVNRVYIEQGCSIGKELYLSLLVDRHKGQITFVASQEGGMDIEEVASTHPEKILKLSIDPAIGCQSFHGREIAYRLGLKDQTAQKMVKIIQNLYKMFTDLDGHMIEINPLVVTTQGDILALDGKVVFDENGLFRHKELEELRDLDEEDPMERKASENALSYIKLDGNIGCMVNGAGLAMATMDVIKLYGGEPANFLDVGGGAPRERVTAAFKLILSDKNVEGILVNIFGGIMRCDVIAEGIVAAAKDVGINVPLVVRLEGTNVDLGKKILETSGLAIISALDLGDAAQKIVQAVKESSPSCLS